MNIEEYFKKQVQGTVKLSRVTRILMVVGIAGVITFATLTGTKMDCSGGSSFCSPNPGFLIPTLLFAFMTFASTVIFSTTACTFGCKQACKWTADTSKFRQLMIDDIQRRCILPDPGTIIIYGAKGRTTRLTQDPAHPVIVAQTPQQAGAGIPFYGGQMMMQVPPGYTIVPTSQAVFSQASTAAPQPAPQGQATAVQYRTEVPRNQETVATTSVIQPATTEQPKIVFDATVM